MAAVNNPYLFNTDARVLGADGRPWQKEEGVEPGFSIPHVWQFSSIIGAAWRSYFQGGHDDAIANDEEYAHAMQRDPLVMSIIQERCKATVNRKWHIEVNDEKDPSHKAVADGLKQVVNMIPHKRQMFSYMLEGAIWAGRVASQFKYEHRPLRLPNWQGAKQDVEMEIPVPVAHQPIDGDKINYTYDGTPTIQIYNPKASTIPNSAVIAGTASRSIALLGSWRNNFIIHAHEIRDAPYWMSQRAGAIYGIGVRHVIYWLSWLKRELLANILTYAERTGMGLRVWKYQVGNEASKRAVLEASQTQTDRTNLLLPVTMTPGGRPVEGVEFVESGSTIATLLLDILRKFDDDIERYIIGQSLSSGEGAAGLGSSGISNFVATTKDNLCEYDADNFGESLTTDLVKKLAIWCKYPRRLVEDANPRFAYQVAKPSPAEKLAAARSVFDMGGRISEKSALEDAGQPKVEEGEVELSLVKLQQQQAQIQTQAANQQAQAQAAMRVQPGGEAGGQLGAEQEPQEEDYGNVMKQLVGEQSQNARNGHPERYAADMFSQKPDLGRYHAALLHKHLGESAPLAVHHLINRLRADPQQARLLAAATAIRDALEPNDDDHEEVRQRLLGSQRHNGHPARFAMPSGRMPRILEDIRKADAARNPAGPMELPHEAIAGEAMRHLGDDAHAKAMDVQNGLATEAEQDHTRHHPLIVATRVAGHIGEKKKVAQPAMSNETEGMEDEPTKLDSEKQRDLFTHGGCGILAQEIHKLLPGSRPVLWKDKSGQAVHAAVLYKGRLLHLGDKEDGYSEVSKKDLDEAVQFDFDPHIDDETARFHAQRLAKQIVSEL